MAIVKRKSKRGTSYQAKVRGVDGSWISETFETRAEAEQWEIRLKIEKIKGRSVTNLSRQVTVAEYFSEWFKETKTSKVTDAGERVRLRCSGTTFSGRSETFL